MRNITLGLFLLFFLSALGFVFAVRHANDVLTEQVMALSDEEFRTQHALTQADYTEVLSVKKLSQKVLGHSTEWKTYVSPVLGFSIRYPDMAMLTSPDCPAVRSPVQIFADNANDRVFVSLANRFGETCATEPLTLRDLQLNYSLSNGYVPWVIDVIDVPTDASITTYLQKKMGPACSMGAMTETAQKGTYDVSIKGDTLPPEESGCIQPFGLAIKYAPAKQKAAVWIALQDAVFWEDADHGESFDTAMAESFRWGE